MHDELLIIEPSPDPYSVSPRDEWKEWKQALESYVINHPKAPTLVHATQFERAQNIVSPIMYIVCTPNPAVLLCLMLMIWWCTRALRTKTQPPVTIVDATPVAHTEVTSTRNDEKAEV